MTDDKYMIVLSPEQMPRHRSKKGKTRRATESMDEVETASG